MQNFVGSSSGIFFCVVYSNVGNAFVVGVDHNEATGNDLGGSMPNFGGNGGMGADFENFTSDAETKNVDIGDAHISVEIDGGKASAAWMTLRQVSS